MDNIANIGNLQIRKIQAIHGERTMVLCIPRDFISDLQICKGDYVKCSVNEKRQLIVEKAFANNEADNNYSNNTIGPYNNIDINKNKPWSGR